jgi:hypothetical protein
MAVEEPSVDELLIYSDGEQNRTPEVRLLHFNDVYHVDASSAEPVGGIARFQTVCNYYHDNERFKGQPDLVTVFSGDAFNPSLESSVTKGVYLPRLISLQYLTRIQEVIWCRYSMASARMLHALV